jgi:tellurite resistance protein
LFEQCDKTVKEGVDKRVASIAPVLKEDPALTEAAFSLASAIAFADEEIKDEENELINSLADALELDAGAADALLNQLEEDSADS